MRSLSAFFLLSALALAAPAASSQTAPADTRFERQDPNGSRLFLAPTGRMMGQGTRRVGTYAVIPTAAYAPSDRLDLQAFSSIPVDLDGSGGDGAVGVIGLGAKHQVYGAERVAVAVGANAFTLYGVDTRGTVVGTLYGAVTLGTSESSVTLGLTGLYGAAINEGFGLAEGAALSVGLERQVSNSLKLISENYLGVGDGSAAGGTLTGVRFFGDRLSADLALAATVGGDGFDLIPIPYVGVSYRF